MSKAILVMDMPKSCDECRLARLVGRSEVMCAIDRMAKRKYEDACKDRPDWCPLRELPQKKEATQLSISPLLPKQYTAFEKGYNACIDEILRGSEAE